MGRSEYLPDSTEVITQVDDLPTSLLECGSRNYRRRLCPRCGQQCPRHSLGHLILHQVGSQRRDRLRLLCVAYSKHHCRPCGLFFSADLEDLASPAATVPTESSAWARDRGASVSTPGLTLTPQSCCRTQDP